MHDNLSQCACGAVRSRLDRQLVGPGLGEADYSRVSLESWPVGTLKKDRTYEGAVLRACQQCATVYALSSDRDVALPEAPPRGS